MPKSYTFILGLRSGAICFIQLNITVFVNTEFGVPGFVVILLINRNELQIYYNEISTVNLYLINCLNLN